MADPAVKDIAGLGTVRGFSMSMGIFCCLLCYGYVQERIMAQPVIYFNYIALFAQNAFSFVLP
jgi:hypothetical protein